MMTDEASQLEVFRCPSCARPTTATLERCRHCFTNFTTGKIDGLADRVFEGGSKGALLGCGGLLVGGTAIAALIAAYNRTATSSLPLATPPSVEAAASPSSSVPSYTLEQRSMICRAGIAAEFGRDPKTMTATMTLPPMMRVTYRRPGDRKLWKYDCQIDGDRIVWRTIDAFAGSGAGRWRTTKDDDVLTFTIKGKAVTTHSSDGSSASETYRF